MTVKELIAVLQAMPPELDVVTQRYSDYRAMEPPTLKEVMLDLTPRSPETKWIQWYPGQHKIPDHIEARLNTVTVCYFEGN